MQRSVGDRIHCALGEPEPTTDNRIARTRSAAHRKGGDFELTTLLAGAATLPALFADLLEALIRAFDALSAAVTV
jgi:hypothetical protein